VYRLQGQRGLSFRESSGRRAASNEVWYSVLRWGRAPFEVQLETLPRIFRA
jgi:hypothetical protein